MKTVSKLKDRLRRGTDGDRLGMRLIVGSWLGLGSGGAAGSIKFKFRGRGRGRGKRQANALRR